LATPEPHALVALEKALNQATKKKRGRSRNERPKSREETPKEGSEASDAIANLASDN
jgi:hypothetical protein